MGAPNAVAFIKVMGWRKFDVLGFSIGGFFGRARENRPAGVPTS